MKRNIVGSFVCVLIMLELFTGVYMTTEKSGKKTTNQYIEHTVSQSCSSVGTQSSYISDTSSVENGSSFQAPKPQTESKASEPSSAPVESEISVSEMENTVPKLKDFKSYTFYDCLSRSSQQWKICNEAGTYTDTNGFRRGADGSYMGAMGSYYAKYLGEKFKITTEWGNVFTVTICDLKADKHTDSTHRYTKSNGCIVEFYVARSLNPKVRNVGSCSVLSELSGAITKVERIG